MRSIRFLSLAAIVSLIAACGGASDGPQYSAVVSFGDSLSDVGTYSVSTIATVGGGRYTVNGTGNKVWVELLAARAGTAAPCAAQTGLESNGPLSASIPPAAITNHAGCHAYAQGGARVTNPIGPDNKAISQLGQMTDPLVNQINRHLTAAGGRFRGDELVTVLAGGNDVFMNLAAINAAVAAATAALGATPASIGAAAQAASAAAVTAMGVAGTELATYVKTLIVAKGATRVVVLNLPDVSLTPFALTLDVQTQGLVNLMSTTYNAQLAAGLNGAANVLLVDAYTVFRDQIANPSKYGLTNVTTPACDLTKTIIPTSLVCTTTTLIAGDTSRFQFSDSVHPTPYGHQLIFNGAVAELVRVGWLE